MNRAERIHDTIVVAILAAIMVLCVGAILALASTPRGCSGSCGINWDRYNWGRGVA